MVADIAGYRYADLLKSRIISSRSDLFRKQRDLGFPKAVKIGDRSAWWPADEVRAWLQGRIALRDGVPKRNFELPRSPPAAARKSLRPVAAAAE
jgi:predicted DNA-binding transcriptional regulator AlpA